MQLPHRPKGDFHDSIVYVDESGDHNMKGNWGQYPVFVLSFCVFEKRCYAEDATTAIQKLKFRYFGHDVVHLHERDIRKEKGPYRVLQDSSVRKAFMDDINQVIDTAQFRLISCVIRKDRLKAKAQGDNNPYDLAMALGMRRVALDHLGIHARSATLHVVFERRGKREDNGLELEFRRFVDGLPIEIVFANKGNYCGLEIADLVSRPIGRYVLNPNQPNRAFDVLKTKFVPEFGLKIFPEL